MDLKLLFHTSFLFLMILDPVGNIPIFVSYLKGYPQTRQRQIVARESIFVLLILLIFFFFGRPFFALLDIEQSSLQIAGSINFFLIGIKMLFAKHNQKELPKRQEEPFIVPLATPAVAGPGIISTVMVFGGNQEISNLLVFWAIIIAWLLLLPVLFAATYLKDLFKENGIIAIERLFAYLVILIAVQMALAGLKAAFIS